ESDEKDTNSEEAQEYAEYGTIEDHVDIDDLSTDVVEDNNHKRIILLEDNDGQPQYKSIYVKDSKRLKIIDVNDDDGLIFNETISDKGNKKYQKDSSKTSSKDTELSEFDEYNTMKKHIDVDDYDVKKIEDNKNKRVIILKDAKGNAQYKSIYIKHKDTVKIIDLDGGLVYKGSLE